MRTSSVAAIGAVLTLAACGGHATRALTGSTGPSEATTPSVTATAASQPGHPRARTGSSPTGQPAQPGPTTGPAMSPAGPAPVPTTTSPHPFGSQPAPTTHPAPRPTTTSPTRSPTHPPTRSPTHTPTTSPASPCTGVTGVTHEVDETTGYRFSPSTITVARCDYVKAVNTDAAVAHTWTSKTGLWDSGQMTNGDTYTYRFMTKGTFDFVCSYHQGAGMVGSVTVQ